MLDELLGALKQGVLNAVRQRTGIDLGAPADPAAQPSTGARGAATAPSGLAGAPPGPAPAQDPLGIGARRMPAGETVDAVLPAQAGEFTRSRINDRFGGIRSGGIFAGYRGDGVEIRVLVTLLRDAAAARAQVGEAGGGGGEQGAAAPTARSVAPSPASRSRPARPCGAGARIASPRRHRIPTATSRSRRRRRRSRRSSGSCGPFRTEPCERPTRRSSASLAWLRWPAGSRRPPWRRPGPARPAAKRSARPDVPGSSAGPPRTSGATSSRWTPCAGRRSRSPGRPRRSGSPARRRSPPCAM